MILLIIVIPKLFLDMQWVYAWFWQQWNYIDTQQSLIPTYFF